MAMAMKKMTSAFTALLVTWLPQDGPTVLSLTVSSPRSLAALASRLRVSVQCCRWDASLHFTSPWTRTTRDRPWPTTWLFASPSPTGRSALRAPPTDSVRDGTSHDVPPLKSIPKLRPRTPRATRPIRMTAPDMANHRSLRPTKSKAVSPWYSRHHRLLRSAVILVATTRLPQAPRPARGPPRGTGPP